MTRRARRPARAPRRARSRPRRASRPRWSSASARPSRYALPTGLRPRRGARRPARRDRALRPRARRADVDARVRALPNLAARSYRLEVDRVPICAPATTRLDRGVVQVVARRPARLRDRRRPRPAPARRPRSSSSRAWRASGTCSVGDTLDVGRLGAAAGRRDRAVARQRRLPAGQRRARLRRRATVRRRFAPAGSSRSTCALLWLHDRGARRRHARAGARRVSFGLAALRSSRATACGSLIGQAAGIVDRAARRVLARRARRRRGRCSAPRAHADVQRRAAGASACSARSGFTPRRGRRRARGARRRWSRCPPRRPGSRSGALAGRRPDRRRCSPRSTSCRPAPALRCRCSARAWPPSSRSSSRPPTWPAWRAARRAAGGAAARRRARARRGPRARARRRRPARRSAPASPPRRARASPAPSRSLGVCAGVVLLHARARLAARAPARRPRHARQALPADRRSRPGARCARSRRIPGVRGRRAALRSSTPPTRSALGEPLRLIAYPGRPHALRGAAAGVGPAAARRRTRPRSALGLADALGLRPGSTLAVQLPGGARGALPRRRRRARARERGPHRLRAPGRGCCAARPRRSARRSRSGCAPGADRRRGRRAAARRSARRAGRGRRRDRRATARSSACSPRCCAVVAAAVGLVLPATRSCRRWR